MTFRVKLSKKEGVTLVLKNVFLFLRRKLGNLFSQVHTQLTLGSLNIYFHLKIRKLTK